MDSNKAYHNKLKENTMKTTKAMNVEQAYYDAKWDNISSEGCYSTAVHTAKKLGGIETSNTNNGNSSISFAPSVTFEFDDLTSVHITYGGVYA